MSEPKVLVVDATQFARGFGRLQHEANRVDVIEVRSHGHVIGGYLSAIELERYKELCRREAALPTLVALPADVTAEIMAGLAALDAGDTVDGEAVFTRLLGDAEPA